MKFFYENSLGEKNRDFLSFDEVVGEICGDFSLDYGGIRR